MPRRTRTASDPPGPVASKVEPSLQNPADQYHPNDSLSDEFEEQTGQQTVLFLQTHPSTFARNLADALRNSGCRVLKINFCVGDWIYWLGRRATNYHGPFNAWEGYLRDFIQREKVTDIIYYGDCKPYHLVAGAVANKLGIRALAYEFGYIRPDWLTLERHGMSTRSHFPSDPKQIIKVGSQFPAADLQPKYRHTMTTELIHEIFYNLSSYFLGFLFHRYNADRYYNPLVEYLTGLPKQFAANRRSAHAQQRINELVGAKRKFFVFPLQLQCDYQLRNHAAFPHQGDAIDAVIRSFAANAGTDSELIFKCHPLDNDAENWPKRIATTAEQSNVTERVHFIDGGDLAMMLDHAEGCVLINSTVGLHSIITGCPTKVLGGAVFDVNGLTFQGPLDAFWQSRTQPDRQLTEHLVNALAGTIQVKGNFFTSEGQAVAIPQFVERITAKSVNGSGAYVTPPPRLADAVRMKL